ncbi:hypothetical protein [Modestobacter roseus]|uniref:Uncharacterized protein n=1 Tax=Modestobacter roseus TaxID=1181884 RepID=A0A562IQM7_9ACTN|nr:hypothetical protein [Modestobacter roseus]MQA34644.1 hypothetical protein [Modestobacter roseus]TWH73116.1 hypothetical protein JD78_01639 [Modestobacter roseus]
MTIADAPGPMEGRNRTRPAPDPLAMSPAEKLAAEWEARHDVAARGHRVPPDAVQHYLAQHRVAQHDRAQHNRAESLTRDARRTGEHEAATPARRAAERPAADETTVDPPAPVPRRRRWPWRRR